LTIPGGSKRYIEALMRNFPSSNVHLSTAISSARSDREGRVVIRLSHGEDEAFDEVILACHGDQAMEIVSNSASKLEIQILGSFQTTPNTVYMHSDTSLLPRRPVAWSAWNYLTTSSPPKADPNHSASGALQTVSLTYNMNILQHIPVSKYSHVLVTMNPPHPPNPVLTQATIQYRHPLYNVAAVRAQTRLDEIQGKRGIWFCGAWTNYGFHEDGFASGVAVGRKLGGSVPWDVVDAKFMRGRKPVFTWKDHLVRLFLLMVQILILTVGHAKNAVSAVWWGVRKRKVV